jgi:hypothetical protein
MNEKWVALFNLSPELLRMRGEAIDDATSVSGTTLRRRLALKSEPIYRRSDLRDATMAFLIVFTGAMVFLA